MTDKGARAKPPQKHDESNYESYRVSIRALVSDPQFRSGYEDRLAGRPPPRFHDSWGLERGRLLATWLLTTGQKPPKANDILGLVRAYVAAEAADALL